MSDCRDCIHYDVCPMALAGCDSACGCVHFKDKSKFIELPCKIGELCYCINDNKVKPCIVITYYLDFCGLMCDLKISQNNYNPNALASANKIIQFTTCNVFLTDAEAEEKLKEMEREKNESL